MWNSTKLHPSSSISGGGGGHSEISPASSSFETSSTFSLTSTAWRAQPTLIKDVNHKPKTHGSFGILVVGLGGANGTTLLAGILANRLNIQWRGPKGEKMTPNYNGCITQRVPHHDGVGFAVGAGGYRDFVEGMKLADATMAAIGGWEIHDTNPGDALLEAQILDYDLVRQLQPEMNKTKLFRGLFDPRFIGEKSRHDNATYILTEQEARSDAEALKCLRADIRYFKWRNGIVGHITVIWSASVEPNSTLVSQIKTANELLDSIEMTEQQRGGALPPSLLYATAALLEGCSFVNGRSQNTLDCPGLAQLAQRQLGVYCLGTGFNSGQTRFKTAAVEYLRTIGLQPKVNREEADIDRRSSSSVYTPLINDDKRDFVEYTSEGFLGQQHTMVTYTRASDSVLCVPLMIDAAVWCDFFSQRSWSYEKVAKALAYIFKVPEGAAKGVGAGFFRQMEELKVQVIAAHESSASRPRSSASRSISIQNGGGGGGGKNSTRRVRIREEGQPVVATEWAIPDDAGVICIGLACLDRQLSNATGGDRMGGEGIETFQGETCIGGGSVSMACRAMARLFQGAPMDDGYMQETPPVVSSVVPICMIGNDDSGNKLLSLLEDCGSASRNVDTRVVRKQREKRSDIRTGLSILPIYNDGRRGCFFDAASNATFAPEQVMDMFGELSTNHSGDGVMVNGANAYGALLFGYPHLLPMMQGKSLAYIFSESRKVMIDGGVVALDLNGVPRTSFARSGEFRSRRDLKNDIVIGPALEHTDILHMNEDELCLLTGCRMYGSREDDEFAVAQAVELFLHCGVAIVAVTRGKEGSYVACSNAERFQRSPVLPNRWINCSAHIPASELPPDAMINTNGAGDSFTAGLVVAAMLRHTGMSVPIENYSAEESDPGLRSVSTSAEKDTRTSPSSKKVTPYTLYMRENYVSLKRQCKDDKRAIFTRCHEMWENENEHVKRMYERMAREENEEIGSNASSHSFNDIDSNIDQSNISTNNPINGLDVSSSSNHLRNASLSLEAAVQFASEIAAHHIDMNTRELDYIDINRLLKKSTLFSSATQEI